MSVKLLAPVFVLVIWSIVMLGWMAFVRFPALKSLKISRDQARGGRGQDLDKLLPREINWPAHNYVHLMEQPTLFYATVICLAVMGQGNMINLALAWGYVGLRIVHSIWQAKVNTIPVRASLFFLSTFVLLALAIHGLIGALAA